ncbi:type III-D CRISPR-associated protein Csx19 [Desulfonatronovibrio magnus]|uniref:type III-D CRISPR-associated protein Csx19 n=1 Tax=Desulfonatronovibrio magnus TaxID=698827 RepID=UPI0005EB9DBB|nr:CRISPR-associated protein Csx19 [Desulfonatronovibrio magnus]
MIYPYELKKCKAPEYEPVRVGNNGLNELIEEAKTKKPALILGNDLDGVIWGRIESGHVSIAHDVHMPSGPAVWDYKGHKHWGPPLRKDTILDLRIFCHEEELRVWRKGNNLFCCRVRESSNQEVMFLDEPQILIAGKRLAKATCKAGHDYSLVQGPAGQMQALPLDWDGRKQKYRLWVRHYAMPDKESGMLTYQESRLIKVDTYDLGVD